MLTFLLVCAQTAAAQRHVYFHTSEHDRSAPQRSVSTTVTLPEASNDTLVLVAAACHGVRSIWRDGYRYSKSGVITVDLPPLQLSHRVLPGFGQLNQVRSGALMEAMDPATESG